MTFEEFLENCSFDYVDYFDGTTDVTVIFSAGSRKEFNKDFVNRNREVANKLAAQELYGYLKEKFKNE